MMRLHLAPEPADFHHKVREPGRRALADRRDAELPPLWRQCLADLHRAYHGICAYYCFYLERANHPGADHFVAKCGAGAELAYEWSNYRLACAHANACKRDYPDVLDPAAIEDGWFQLDPYSLIVSADPALPEATRAQVDETIARLKLNESRALETRARAKDQFLLGLTLAGLHKYFPFFARELERQGIRSSEQLESPPAAVAAGVRTSP